VLHMWERQSHAERLVVFFLVVEDAHTTGERMCTGFGHEALCS
jgi:hypothetical protein